MKTYSESGIFKPVVIADSYNTIGCCGLHDSRNLCYS